MNCRVSWVTAPSDQIVWYPCDILVSEGDTSAAGVVLCTLVEGPLRPVPAPADLCCIAPGCGARHVAKGESTSPVLDAHKSPDPDTQGYVWQTATLVGPVPTLLLFLTAVCPRQRCWMAAFDRLGGVIAAHLGDGRIPDACAHCGTRGATLPCHDGCGRELYCKTACTDSGLRQLLLSYSHFDCHKALTLSHAPSSRASRTTSRARCALPSRRSDAPVRPVARQASSSSIARAARVCTIVGLTASAPTGTRGTRGSVRNQRSHKTVPSARPRGVSQ